MATTRGQELTQTAWEQKPKPVGKITYEEFLDWIDEDIKAEWVDGEIEMSSPATSKHQDILNLLYTALKKYGNFTGLGRALAPFHMKLPGVKGSGREPDVIFVLKEHFDLLKPSYINGPADFVVEVISPESVKRDQEVKLQEYAEAGILEYWLINPLRNKVVFYQLEATGIYKEYLPDNEGKYFSSVVKGFWIKPEWLWEAQTFSDDDILLDVLGDDYAQHLVNKVQKKGLLRPKQ